MKILLSAYACEPGKGSEPGVGWHWAVEIARAGHITHVLTRKNNEANIASELAREKYPEHLQFHYYDLPQWLRWWKRGPRGVYLYNLLWQMGAAARALSMSREIEFDFIHHLTFGSIRLPSFMGVSQIPLIVGPLGGGETAPYLLRQKYSVRAWLKDAVRDVSNWVVRIDPFMRFTYRRARVIFLRTRENRPFVPQKYRHKIVYLSDVGAPEVGTVAWKQSPNVAVRVLYVGRLIDLKGMDLGFRAFAEVRRKLPSARLTIVGTGPSERKWRRLARQLEIDSAVDWLGWIDKASLPHIYGSHDVFLFPSLHDSGGSVILEAASHGLPIVCLDLGGPGELVTPACGIKVSARARRFVDVVSDLSIAILRLCPQSDEARSVRKTSVAWARANTWSVLVQKAYAGLTELSDE